MSDSQRVVVHVSDIRVEIECPASAGRALAAVWAPASQAAVPTRTTTRWDVVTTDEQWILRVDGAAVRNVPKQDSLTLAIETELVSRMVDWHPHACLLHAGLVEVGGVWVLFVGRSGAGKSSLTLEAVRRGGRYFSDEIVITDGKRVWGVGRTTVFDVGPVDRPLPERLSAADTTTYQFRGPDGVLLARPIIAVPSTQWATEPIDARSIAVVRVHGQGTDEIVAASGPEGLATLLEASCTPGWRELGPLVSGRRSFMLSWATPASGLDAITNATRHLASGPSNAPR